MADSPRCDTPRAAAPHRPSPRHHLLSVSRRLMLSRGIRCVTMDEIARTGGMSKRTIYTLFDTKTALLRAMLLEDTDCFAYKSLRDTGDAMHVLLRAMLWGWRFHRSINPQFLNDLWTHYPSIAQEHYMHIQQEHMDRFQRLLRQGQREGVFLEGVDAKMLAKLTVEAVRWFKDPAIFAPEEYPPERMGRAFMELVAHGIATAQGLESLARYMEREEWIALPPMNDEAATKREYDE